MPLVRFAVVVAALGMASLPAARAAADPVRDATAADGLFAVFETSMGTFVCRLEHEKCPVNVGNFVGLAEGERAWRDPRTGQFVTRRFYDGLRIHRIVPGFIIQGGDPSGDGTGGPGYDVIDEIDPGLRFDAPGALAMASAGPDRNGSQFFVTLAAAPHLDDRVTRIGQVVQGMDVVEAIAAEPRTGLDRTTPVSDILLRKVRIVRTGLAAEGFDAAQAFARQDGERARRDAAKRAQLETFQAQLAQDRARAVRTPSGLQYVVLQAGSGTPPKPGDTISTHCTGWLEKDGTRFWSTSDRGEPFRVVIGVGKVIKAWEEAYLDMRPGERRRLLVPPELGYGAQGNPRAGIPGNARLVFDVELLAVEPH